MTKQKDYKEIERLADCLKNAAIMSDDSSQKLYGITKDEALRNILSAIENRMKK